MGEDLSPEAVRRKQKLKSILTIIGESLQDYFKEKIAETKGQKPSMISIVKVNSIEKDTSKSKVHLVVYSLNTDIGSESINLVVKFPADVERYEKELRNYDLISSSVNRIEGFFSPKMVYKSSITKCLIYEGIEGSNFRESSIDKNTKHRLAGELLAAIHGNDRGTIDISPYKKLIVHLISTISNAKIEQELIDLFLPSLLSLENAQGGAMIHGDYYGANILFKTPTADSAKKEGLHANRVYIIDPEYIAFNRDRCEDIGTFYAKQTLREYQKYGNFHDSLKDYKEFIAGYNNTLKRLGSDFLITDLYPRGLTVDFHIAFFILYDITNNILSKNLDISSPKVLQSVELLEYILEEKPYANYLI